MHLIHSPHLRLINHLFRLRMRMQTPFQPFNLSQKPSIALPYDKLSFLFALPLQSSFLLRARKLALRTGVSRSRRVSQLAPLLLLLRVDIFGDFVGEDVFFE
jgi:hypothetical protein